ncbi:MAG TPA: 4-hydroxy-tetrahydrodipicolinate synthase [Bacteroidia bacterium]|jgi:4-hydroxy-tetrahydrodipicolinate synthase|nr:4-hydroxy-tetrahydrodipicolinate synthase [Bacteroidia bacterium]
MSLLNKLKGTGVALVTPFTKNHEVDYNGLTNLVKHVIKGKCEYVVVLGTTGESVTLSKEEKLAVTNTVIKAAKGKVPVVLGVGGNNTNEVLHSLKTTDFTGIDAILSVSPSYNKPSQAGIVEHFKLVAKASPVPVILYNVPGRTGSNMSPATTLKIARECKNVIAIKEASGNVEQVMSIIQNAPDNFLVISGDDGITLPLVAAGAVGVISVVANAYPLACSSMVRSALKNDFVKSRKFHYGFYGLIPMLFEEGNPAGVKVVLKQLGVCGDDVRMPLVKVSKDLEKRIHTYMKYYKG